MNDGPSALEALVRAREQTLAAGSARVALFTDYEWGEWPSLRRRRGGLLRPVIALGKGAAKGVWKLATRNVDFHHHEDAGFIDLPERRYMLDGDIWAQLYASGKGWYGAAGSALQTLTPEDWRAPLPLWLLDLLASVTEAQEVEVEEVRGTSCRRLAAKTDFNRAWRAAPGSLAVPSVGSFEDLLAFPVEVWIDEAHVRRVRCDSDGRFSGDRICTLELWDFGTSLDGLDWTRLPAFGSSEGGSRLAGSR